MDTDDLKRFYGFTGNISAKAVGAIYFWTPIVLFLIGLLGLPFYLIGIFLEKIGLKKKEPEFEWDWNDFEEDLAQCKAHIEKEKINRSR